MKEQGLQQILFREDTVRYNTFARSLAPQFNNLTRVGRTRVGAEVKPHIHKMNAKISFWRQVRETPVSQAVLSHPNPPNQS